MYRMDKMRDLEKQAATPEQKPQEDWRKKALYNLHRNSEAAQERTSSSSDQDLELGVDIALPSKRRQLRNQRWLENRGSVTAASSESQIHGSRFQEVKAVSRHDDANSSTRTRQLGELKGGTPRPIRTVARALGIGTEHQAGVFKDENWRPTIDELNAGTAWHVGSSRPEESEN